MTFLYLNWNSHVLRNSDNEIYLSLKDLWCVCFSSAELWKKREEKRSQKAVCCHPRIATYLVSPLVAIWSDQKGFCGLYRLHSMWHWFIIIQILTLRKFPGRLANVTKSFLYTLQPTDKKATADRGLVSLCFSQQRFTFSRLGKQICFPKKLKANLCG